MMKARKHKNKIGMTLVEIILAMAILSLVVILMTPVLVSGFKMITLSGNRHVNAKSVAGDVENNLAGETVTASLHDISIQLPGDIVVNGKSYTINQGNGARQADLDGYIINSIPFFDPAPSDVALVTVDVSGWRSDYPYGLLKQTTSEMKYQIYPVGNPPPPPQIRETCNETQTRIEINNDSAQGYQVVVWLGDDYTNRKELHIRPTPRVFFKQLGDKVNFYICDSDHPNGRLIKENDQIELVWLPGGIWTRVVSEKGIKLENVGYIYARYAASSGFEPSLPRHVGPQ